jgi:hypothetical protein
MNSKEELKAQREFAVFEEFCAVRSLDIAQGSARCQRLPQPDITCTIEGATQEFELVEITDEGVASSLAESIRTGEVTGGEFSQDEPLIYAFTSKQAKRYDTSAPLNLLAYYDKQYPWSYADPSFIEDTVGAVAAEMIASGTWSRIFVYDTWERKLLWTYP